MDYDVIIIGGGASGLTAGIYSSRGMLKTLLLEKGIPGGLAATTDLIENYPGFPDGVGGVELMDKIKRQTQKFGAAIVQAEVKSVKPTGDRIIVKTDKNEYSTYVVIVASGTIPKKLGVPGEDRFRGRGVSYCATCDGALFKGKDAAVIGCGNSGLQEGEFLLKFTRTVTFIEFLPDMTAEKILQERFRKRSNVKFLLNHVLTSINGKDMVSSIVVKDRATGQEKTVEVSGVFIYVGFIPNSNFLKGAVKLDEKGYIITNQDMETSVPGIFAAGDVCSKQVRQIANAVGEGAVAAVMAEKYIMEKKG